MFRREGTKNALERIGVLANYSRQLGITANVRYGSKAVNEALRAGFHGKHPGRACR